MKTLKLRIKDKHAKIKNCRKDHLHKESSKLVKRHALIVVGNLKASKLVKTKMAKSVLYSGFSAFRAMLRYKCENTGVLFEEINESYTTQTGLGIREWQCECGITHHRDTNSAKVILALGHERLAVEIPVL